MPDPILIRLTQPELELLMHSLNIASLPGIADDLLVGLNEEQQKGARASAEQTLRARRFVGWDSDLQRVINPLLANLLLDYALPTATLFVDTGLPAGRATPFLYVRGQQGIYEQCQPEPDILQFRVLSNSEELERRLSPHLPEERFAQPEHWQGRIMQRLLSNVLRLVSRDENSARRYFEAVLPSELAQALAVAYHAPRAVQYIACWHTIPTKEHPAPRAALTILQGSEHAFLLWVEEPERREAAMVHVEPFLTASLSKYIKKIVPLFMEEIHK